MKGHNEGGPSHQGEIPNVLYDVQRVLIQCDIPTGCRELLCYCTTDIFIHKGPALFLWLGRDTESNTAEYGTVPNMLCVADSQQSLGDIPLTK